METCRTPSPTFSSLVRNPCFLTFSTYTLSFSPPYSRPCPSISTSHATVKNKNSYSSCARAVDVRGAPRPSGGKQGSPARLLRGDGRGRRRGSCLLSEVAGGLLKEVAFPNWKGAPCNGDVRRLGSLEGDETLCRQKGQQEARASRPRSLGCCLRVRLSKL